MRRVIVPVAAGAVLIAVALLTDLRSLSKRGTGPGVPPADASREGGFPWLTDEATALKVAREKKLPVLIDFTADWCVPCHELEEGVFSRPDFIARKDKLVGLRIDVTEETPEKTAILARYHVNGLPTIVFIGRDGKIHDEARIEGAAPLSEFLQRLDSL